MLKYVVTNLLKMTVALYLGAFGFNLYAVTTQHQPPTIPNYFRHLSVQEGLSQVTVSDIQQDENGFIWFATQNGINRFDGYEFIQYKRDKLLTGSGPIGDYAYKLALDKDSSDIWVATSGGLSRYLYESDQFKHYDLIGADGERRYIVSTVLMDRFGQLWAGTRHGLFRYDRSTDSFSPVRFDISASAWVLDIERDKSGELLVATTEGLFAIDPENPNEIVSALKGEQINDIELLNSGELWISTTGRGVLRKKDGEKLANGLEVIKEISQSNVKSGVNSIEQLKNGDIWVSTNTGLTLVKFGKKLISVDLTKTNDSNNLLSAAHMTRTYESRSGLVWQGTWTGGFSIYDPDSQQVDSFAMLPGSWVRGLEKDDKDNVWFGAPNGIWKRNLEGTIDGPWLFPSQTSQRQNEAQRFIRSLAFDRNNDRFWVGTTSGLFVLQKESAVLESANALNETNIFFVDTDPQGDLWVGTFNKGLYWLDAQSLAVKGHWAVATVTHFHLSDDTVYAGTIEGLILIDKRSKAFVNLNDESRPEAQRSPRVVTWISKSKDGSFLLGSQGSGIYRMRENSTTLTFEPLYSDSHLATLSIGGIKEDKNNNIWASTTEGIAKIDSESQTISYYDKRNGAYSEGYYINHSIQLASGEILFAGPKGMSSLIPERIALSKFTPNVTTTKLRVLNKPVIPSIKNSAASQIDKPFFIADRILLGPEDNVFSVEFSALDYSSPENNLYEYKLEGFDNDWIRTDAKHRVATYTNLDPGSYVLKIKGSNKDGIWSNKIKSLDIIVLPPWYWSSLTQILWAVLIISVVTALYRWRIWSLEAQSNKLRRLVKQRTIELEEKNLKLVELSTMDELTKLKNRRGFGALAKSELEQYKRIKKPFSILMVDIDHFKDVNDKLGHAAGDTILVCTAEKMKSLIRKQDHIARWGGEEFIILAVDTPIKSAAILAEKLRKKIQENQIDIDGCLTSVTVTVGVTEIQPDQSLEQCINLADKNLYYAKDSGRNKICY